MMDYQHSMLSIVSWKALVNVRANCFALTILVAWSLNVAWSCISLEICQAVTLCNHENGRSIGWLGTDWGLGACAEFKPLCGDLHQQQGGGGPAVADRGHVVLTVHSADTVPPGVLLRNCLAHQTSSFHLDNATVFSKCSIDIETCQMAWEGGCLLLKPVTSTSQSQFFCCMRKQGWQACHCCIFHCTSFLHRHSMPWN